LASRVLAEPAAATVSVATSDRGEPITATSVLPAGREPILLTAADGVPLIAEIARPLGPVRATVIALHPLTTHGGSMDSHLLRKMAARLPALAGVAVLRLNTRGAVSRHGASGGAFDYARGEGADLAAACAWVDSQPDLPDPWVLGWSFGADIALRHADRPPVVGVILLSPTLWLTPQATLTSWAMSARPMIALIPQRDHYLPPALARERFTAIPALDLIVVPQAGHLLIGEPSVRLVLDEVAARLVPGRAPLPRYWRGRMEQWNELPSPAPTRSP